MPTIYLNGGSPNYTGAIFTNANELLALIKQTLESAGWLTITYVPGVNLFAKGTTLVNAHNCWVEFAISATTLTIRGWLEEAKTNGSPDAIHTHLFTPNSDNRLWLTADEDSGCICIFSDSTGESAGTHFGFLQRIDNVDLWAWMIGRTRVDGLEWAYVAKAKINDVNWRLLSLDYLNAAGYNNLLQNLPLSTFDLVCRGKPGGSVASNANYQGLANTNPFYLAHQGRRNYNNKPLVDPFCYLEGRGATTSYSNSSPLFCRGFVKHAFCGVASETAVSQILDPLTNNRILATGGTLWQGMRIL